MFQDKILGSGEHNLGIVPLEALEFSLENLEYKTQTFKKKEKETINLFPNINKHIIVNREQRTKLR